MEYSYSFVGMTDSIKIKGGLGLEHVFTAKEIMDLHYFREALQNGSLVGHLQHILEVIEGHLVEERASVPS